MTLTAVGGTLTVVGGTLRGLLAGTPAELVVTSPAFAYTVEAEDAVAQTLTVDYTGATEPVTVQWFIDRASPTPVLDSAPTVAGTSTEGSVLTVTPGGYSGAETIALTYQWFEEGEATGPGAPVNTAPPAVTGSTLEGQTLTATPGTYADTTDLALAYQWHEEP